MYKLLLCCRYLRTRYIALASVISVMLGVATMIVVNSVMEGFTSEMQDRIHNIIGDLTFDSLTLDGMPNFEARAKEIRRVAGDDIEAMSPVVAVPAMLQYQCGGNWITRQVDLIGIDEKTQSAVSGFGGYLQHPENRDAMSFDLRKGGYDVRDHQSGKDAPQRVGMDRAGWQHRIDVAKSQKFYEKYIKKPETRTAKGVPSANPFDEHPPAGDKPENIFDAEKSQHPGAVLGFAMTSYRSHEGQDRFRALPGDDVILTFATVGQPPKATSDNFTIVDFYESKMSEYDSKFVFVPIRDLQRLRGMFDRDTDVWYINSIQIKLKPGVDGDAVRDRLRQAFSPEMYAVSTWRDKQGPLLAAVDLETRILNLLLFFIIAVAGFGILAIFYMIVVEKTRDIGILKSLGASSSGVMGIFLGYGLSLGLVGSGIGMIAGLLIVRYINEIAAGLAWATGKPVFDPSIYYFYKIPAIVVPETLIWIVAGALMIAVAASILPARRAARLHPVEALRYE